MKNRSFRGEPITRLVLSIEISALRRLDWQIRQHQLAGGNRSEFIRQAIEAHLARLGVSEL